MSGQRSNTVRRVHIRFYAGNIPLNIYCRLTLARNRHQLQAAHNTHYVLEIIITFRVRHRRGEMYTGHGRLCVCLSLAVCPHDCTDPDVSWGMVRGVLYSCALLGGFAIGAPVSLV